MTHYFEFQANLHNGNYVKHIYKGKHSRHSRVRDAILADLMTMYQIPANEVKDLYLKPYKLKQ